MALRNIPFGGSGESGMGRYAGKYSFDTFSHEKPIAVRSHGTEFLNNDRYPCYDKDKLDEKKKNEKQLKQIKMYERLYPKQSSTFMKMLKYGVLISGIVAFAYYYQRFYINK